MPKSEIMPHMEAGIRQAGIILLVTGAGGAFGQVLKSTPIGSYLGEVLSTYNLGIFLPFIIAAALKTSQGSSTVAIITTSALLAPMLPSLGLDAAVAKALVVMSIGAGAMTVSHANDSYFWVVSQFSNMDTDLAYKTYSTATLLQGIVTIIFVAILAMIFI